MDFKQTFNQLYSNQWEKFEKSLKKLQNMISYQFSNLNFLYSALSIRGSKLPKDQFERSEFLGDSLLKAIQGILLFEKSNEFDPGDLTKLRMNLENNRTLAKLAEELPFNEFSMILGIGILSDSQAADCFESLIGAIYLDNGKQFDKLLELIRRITHFEKNYKKILNEPWGGKDPKSFLHEWAQKTYRQNFQIDFPSENRGRANAPEFYVKCLIKRKSTGKIEIESIEVGPCIRIKDGEKEAAKSLLIKLQEEGRLNN